MQKKRFVSLGLALAIAVLAAGCKERRRTATLEALAEEREAPAYAEAAARSRDLAEAAGRLADAPGEPTLAAARARWQEALGAWSATFPFRPSGLTQLAPHFHVTFWPPEPRLMQTALAGGKPVDQGFVDGLGISAKGLYALETLLWGAPKDATPPLVALEGDAGARRRAYLRAVADDVARQAHAAAAIVGERSFAATFAREGQAALNRLVNDQIAVLEGIVTERLTFMVGALDNGTLSALPFQGRASGSSFVITQNLLRGVATIYAPGPQEGLSRLVHAAAPDADGAVLAALARARASVDALGGPLEAAVTRDRAAVDRACKDVRALEMLFKTNVASALGVTITFTAGDGD